MGVIRDAAQQPIEVDLSGRYDPSLVHYWDEVRPRGEWPTTVIAPVCTPSQRRTVSVDVVDRATDPDPAVMQASARCPDCESILAAMGEALKGVRH